MHTLNELNVTPLLDLAFVLLLIFMITTPLMENSNDLILPSGRQEGAPVDMNGVVQISLFRDERISIENEPVALTQLTSRLDAMRQERPIRFVLLRMHKELTVQQLMDVTEAIKAAQITKIGLAKVTEESVRPK
jgi:biopolymer transport protein ExbD